MQHVPINGGLVRGEFVVVRLLRRWKACRLQGADALPSLVALASDLGAPPPLAAALQSVFHLTEACLELEIETACLCDATFSADEAAVLQLIRTADHQRLATKTIPHGLPGVLAWAAATVRLMLKIDLSIGLQQTDQCPFVRLRGGQMQTFTAR